jgi:hypothetical protein
MACAMAVESIDEEHDQVVFRCATCDRTIAFALPDTGQYPVAVADGASWRVPDNFLDWMDPCP